MARFPFPMPRPRRQAGTSRRARPMFGVGRGRGGGGGLKMRLLIAAGLAIFALISYYGNPGDRNLITGDMERVAFEDEEDEIRLGLQAAPEMVQQHGGPSQNRGDRDRVTRVGFELLTSLEQQLAQQPDRTNPYQFQFTLLADRNLVNAFALPGGQIFITEALYRRLESPGQLAAVLGHEIGHVIERHGNKRMAQQKLFQGLAAAGGVAGGDVNSQRMAQMVANMAQMKYGREDELESDKWGVRLTVMSGYDPYSMIGLMNILEEASGGGSQPEFMSTHPKPANRRAYIEQVIEATFPNGLPQGLRK